MKLYLKLLLAITFLMQGCSSPKDATKANFEKAIINSGMALSLCIEIPGEYTGMSKYPTSLPSEPNYFGYDQGKIALHDLLVANGLETVSAEKKELPGDMFIKGKTVEYKTYNITEKGKDHLYRIKSFMSSGNYLCFGEVDEINIDNFSEPAQMMAHTISEVKFSYEIKNLPDWISKNSDLVAKFTYKPGSKSAAKVSDKATLVLTDAGWVEGRSFQSGNKELEKVGV